jgi:hypothetical protein
MFGEDEQALIARTLQELIARVDKTRAHMSGDY